MENSQINAEDLKSAYKCTFSEDRRLVTIVISSQWILPALLQFGEDLPANAGTTPEQFQVLLEAPIQDGFAMMAMAKIELYSHQRQLHARFGKKVDQEDFLTILTSQIHRLVNIKKRHGGMNRPVTRMPLEKLVDDINGEPLSGDVGVRGHQFVSAWMDKNLAIMGDVGETIFLANAKKIYHDEYARRHFTQNGPEQES
jgi:hypothetical protein